MNESNNKNYYHKKYGLTLPHSEVIEAIEHYKVEPRKILDLGSGQGRNSLYLNQLGFDVTAVEQNEMSLIFLNDLIKEEGLEHLYTKQYDINQAAIEEYYDLILSTVVFMFLDAASVPAIIKNMQAQTNAGGYNLIVSAMSTDAYPCHQGFSFTFGEGELKAYYKDWELVKYNETIGELHRRDREGNRIKLQFATMLARKP